MPYTSVSTYARALSGNKLPHVAAGDYENKLSTKIMKGILYVLTAGLAYGFTRVIEHYCNTTAMRWKISMTPTVHCLPGKASC